MKRRRPFFFIDRRQRRKLIKSLDQLMAHEEVIIESHGAGVTALGAQLPDDQDDAEIVAIARTNWRRANRLAVELEALGVKKCQR